MSLPLIVVPVFNALEHLDACLKSIGRTVPLNTEVIVIDDASTDSRVRPAIQAWVDEARPHRRLIIQEQNRGFVATANLGMRLANKNVVLLNSDTEVHGQWLQNLGRCLASDASIATATPWSNNGEIVSIPQFCVSNPIPEQPESIAEVINSCARVIYPELPTAVGFCMAISLQAIRQIGLFDEASFGMGYGEENDFCQRAEQHGMRNVLCDDSFVVHHGGASFGPLGIKADENSMSRLLSKHPDYQRKVMAFIQEDPLAVRRQEILNCLEREGLRMG